MTNLLEFFSTQYKKVTILGDFNGEAEHKVMRDFFQEHTLYNMMKQNTRLKGDGSLCIDLLITNTKFSFTKTNSLETGLGDHHHHLIYTILKTKFGKFEPKKINIQEFLKI